MVKAVNAAGVVISGESRMILAATPQQPAQPVNDASVTNDSQIQVTYGTVLPDDGGSKIINIQLWMDDGQGGDLQPVTPDSELSMRTVRLFTGLTKSRIYRFSYRVANVNGWSDLSGITMIRASIQPSKPEKPLLVAATASSIELKLFKPEDNGGSEILSFELYRNDGHAENEPTMKVDSYDTNLLTHTLTVAGDGIEEGKIYKFVFRAINEVGESFDSNIAEYAICDVPAAPEKPEVMLDHTTETQIAVSWPRLDTTQAPGSTITGYLLEMKDTSDLYGTFETVFDGSDLYPDWR